MNRAQELQIAVIRSAESFNGFHANRIADLLESNEDFYESCIAKQPRYIWKDDTVPNPYAAMDWTELIHLKEGYWWMDVLYILAHDHNSQFLKDWVEFTFWADEVSWLPDNQLDKNSRGRKILRVWWD